MPDQSDMDVLLTELFPDGIGVCFSAQLPRSAQLFPEELAATPNMVAKRLIEFRHGRYCAHTAMAKLGIAPAPVRKGIDRAPIWPTGLTGSITHTGDAAASAVAHCEAFRSVGLDMETSAPLTPEIIAMVCRPTENPDNDGNKAKLFFSIKESIYKCLYPIVRKYIDFLDVEVSFDPSTSSFRAHAHNDACPNEIVARLRGRSVIKYGYVISGAWIK